MERGRNITGNYQRRRRSRGKLVVGIVFSVVGTVVLLFVFFVICAVIYAASASEKEPRKTTRETYAGEYSEKRETVHTTETSAVATTSTATSATSTETTETSATSSTSAITLETTTATSAAPTLTTVVDSNRDELGSAAELSGKIIIVSIFTSDLKGSWDFSDSHDKDLRKTARKDLDIATEWIEDSAADYGRYVEFIWDFNTYKDLEYETELSIDAFETLYTPSYTPFYEAVYELVPTDALMKKYNADGIIYMMFFDDEYRDDKRSCSRPYYGHPDYDYEMSFINMNRGSWTTRPSSIAHEILHLFGAPDLYFPNSHDTGITQEYVDYIADTNLNDIMRIVTDPVTRVEYPDKIVNEITDITAYYVGLTDYSWTVAQWGFNPSEHVA